MQETWVQPLGQEDPMEKGMATHSSIHAQIIPWAEEPGGLGSMGHKELDTAKQLTLSFLYHFQALFITYYPMRKFCSDYLKEGVNCSCFPRNTNVRTALPLIQFK